MASCVDRICPEPDDRHDSGSFGADPRSWLPGATPRGRCNPYGCDANDKKRPEDSLHSHP